MALVTRLAGLDHFRLADCKIRPYATLDRHLMPVRTDHIGGSVCGAADELLLPAIGLAD